MPALPAVDRMIRDRVQGYNSLPYSLYELSGSSLDKMTKLPNLSSFGDDAQQRFEERPNDSERFAKLTDAEAPRSRDRGTRRVASQSRRSPGALSPWYLCPYGRLPRAVVFTRRRGVHIRAAKMRCVCVGVDMGVGVSYIYNPSASEFIHYSRAPRVCAGGRSRAW